MSFSVPHRSNMPLLLACRLKRPMLSEIVLTEQMGPVEETLRQTGKRVLLAVSRVALDREVQLQVQVPGPAAYHHLGTGRRGPHTSPHHPAFRKVACGTPASPWASARQRYRYMATSGPSSDRRHAGQWEGG